MNVEDRNMIKLYNMNLVGESADKKDDHIFACHDALRHAEMELSESLANQRRRMGKEFDELAEKLKTVQDNASWELNDYAQSMGRANKRIFALEAELKKQFDESIEIIHNTTAENIKLKEEITRLKETLERRLIVHPVNSDAHRRAASALSECDNALDPNADELYHTQCHDCGKYLKRDL